MRRVLANTNGELPRPLFHEQRTIRLGVVLQRTNPFQLAMREAGDDAAANEIAAGLAAEIGFEPIYLGTPKESRPYLDGWG